MSAGRSVDAGRLVAFVEAFATLRPVVLGDLVADEFVHGDIARVSREAPVLVLDEKQTLVVPGGAGNSVANLRSLGARPRPLGVVGRDAAGSALLAELRDRGVSTAGISRVTDYATPRKTRILAGGTHTRRQQIVRLDRGAPRGELPAPARQSLRKALSKALRGCHGVLVADYGYGAASPSRALLGRLGGLVARGVPVTVDSRARVGLFRGVTACTPNQEEVEQAVGAAALDDAAILDAGRRLLRRTRNRAVLVTRGAAGMSLFRPRRPPVHVPAWGSGEVADVTGAGDTVIAVFTLALMAGADPADAARLSNYAAGIVVTKAGTATVAPEELIAAIDEDLRR